jgi:hypothetical protein
MLEWRGPWIVWNNSGEGDGGRFYIFSWDHLFPALMQFRRSREGSQARASSCYLDLWGFRGHLLSITLVEGRLVAFRVSGKFG